MLNIYIVFTIYSLCLFPGILLAQNSVKIQSKSTVSRLENYIASAAKMGKLNGSVLIAKERKVLLQKGYGWRNFANHTRNDSSTIFEICSLTKPFTAMVILKLQEEGKLSVNDPLDKYFPRLP